MQKGLVLLGVAGIALVAACISAWWLSDASFETGTGEGSFTEQEAGFEPAPEAPAEDAIIGFNGRYSVEELRDWQRPDGPLRVALQVGHLQNDEVPEELSQLTYNGAGATWGGLNERDTVEVVAQETAERLRMEGIEVDILPTTVSPGYYADAFVSIHADGNNNERARGYKSAHFSHDYSGRSHILEDMVNDAYAEATGLPEDPRGTYRMSGYYAFNWWRYEHALHPMAPAIILETGFLTNAADRGIIVDQPSVAAEGIANGIIEFLRSDAFTMLAERRVILPETPFSGRYNCLEGEWDANDPPEERDAPCRPGLMTDTGARYGFVFADTATPTALSSIASGTPIMVNGIFTPMVGVRDLSWYDYRVRGTIEVTDLRQTDQ